ncbi:peptidase inhibitor family I36 protein [Streptomyces sudanensis]|uniref:peptidase inhibitor family I36 protein n=1 Tax=Streptomyces sudanensis TaxID=436397 RepID=UPI0020CD6888|nr:peptidase inhibitor family I36 protein [Streptomyces sudanensis]MCP9988278.1 peptidase inhibitor family I36 protein [Streptomyces sudanensis]
MRKFAAAAAVLGLAALGVTAPATAAQATDNAATSALCDSKWGPRNGNMYAWEHINCDGALLMVSAGNSSWWGGSQDRASSVMNRGYTGNLAYVKFYEHANHGGGHACLSPYELYADNLTDNRLSNGVSAHDTISSHKWVNSGECSHYLT